MAEGVVTGGCVCGGVRFEVALPLVGAGWCHCSRCRHRTGSHASANGATRPGSFRFLGGEELVTEFEPPGGFVKAFCSVCGGHLYSREPGGWQEVSVRLGALDGDPGVPFGYHQHVETVPPWLPVPDDGLPQYPGRRPRE
jgi:hypothetical protein